MAERRTVLTLCGGGRKVCTLSSKKQESESGEFMNQLRVCTVRLGLLISLALCLSQATTAQLVPYDNFNSKNIDPTKWTGFQFFTPDQREAVRELVENPGASGRQQP